MKIAILGAPGTGKTTLAEDVNNELKYIGYNSEVVPEFARSFIRDYGSIEHVSEQIMIVHGQIELEERTAAHHDIVICDSCSLLCYIYGSIAADRSNKKDRYYLNYVHKMILDHLPTYDMFWFVPKEREIMSDNIRSQTDSQAEIISGQIEALLRLEVDKFHVITGNREERLNKAKLIMANTICEHILISDYYGIDYGITDKKSQADEL